ncbi:MAG: LapA family protein [Lyngbya sp.]|nr:LapA family protein [Lyngbya sp.]
MRPLNFVLIFIVCILLVLFSLQNTELATIQLIEGVEFEAPLAIELIAATGVGALLAWVFALLSQVQRIVSARQNMRQIRQQEQRIQELEKDLQQVHQQGQRIEELEGDVEKIHAEEKNNNSKTVVSTANSPKPEAKPVTESENLTENSEKQADTDKETVNAEA